MDAPAAEARLRDRECLALAAEQRPALFARLDENYRSAIPSKLFEYLSTGLPIIYCGDGEASRLLRRFEQTTCLASNDDEGLRNAILKLKSESRAKGTSIDLIWFLLSCKEIIPKHTKAYKTLEPIMKSS